MLSKVRKDVNETAELLANVIILANVNNPTQKDIEKFWHNWYENHSSSTDFNDSYSRLIFARDSVIRKTLKIYKERMLRKSTFKDIRK
jgi:hypothetical protein